MMYNIFNCIAVADAYGSGFEFKPANFVEQYNNVDQMYKHELHGLEAGQYTDDTQMTMGLIEYLLNGYGVSRYDLVKSWLDCYQRDKRPAYAKRFQQFIELNNTPELFINNIDNNSTRSGSAMRVAPIGLVKDIDWIKHFTSWQSCITHNTSEAREASMAAALLVHYCHFNIGDKNNVGNWINTIIAGNIDWNRVWTGKVNVQAIDCVSAAITVVRNATSLYEVLKQSVAFTGDTDTVAVLACAASSQYQGMIHNIDHLFPYVEPNGKYGIKYLNELHDSFTSWLINEKWKNFKFT